MNQLMTVPVLAGFMLSSMGLGGSVLELGVKCIDKNAHPTLRSVAETISKVIQVAAATLPLTALLFLSITIGAKLLVSLHTAAAIGAMISVPLGAAFCLSHSIADNVVNPAAKAINTIVLAGSLAVLGSSTAGAVLGVASAVVNLANYFDFVGCSKARQV